MSTTASDANIRADEIACIRNGSEWSNVVLDLEENNHILEMTPEPNFATGTVLYFLRIFHALLCICRKLCCFWLHWML